MAILRYSISFAALLIGIGLLCSGLTGNPSGSLTPTISGTPLPPASSTPVGSHTQPATATQIASPQASSTPSRCQAAMWQVIPTGWQMSQTTTDGWKIVVVTHTVENNSPFWGEYARPDVEGITIVTEEGFTYTSEPAGGWLFLPPMLPPHFRSGTGLLSFRVPATQNHFRVNVANASVTCIRDGQRQIERVPTTVLDLDRDIQAVHFPTDDSAPAFPDLIGQPIEIEGRGILTFTRALRLESGFTAQETYDLLYLELQFTNVNRDRDVEVSFWDSYFIGDDGVAYKLCGGDCPFLNGKQPYVNGWGHLSAGPSQTITSATACFIRPQVSSIKYVWVSTYGASVMSDEYLLYVYNLPESAIAAATVEPMATP